MNIMSKSFPVVLRLEWADDRVTARQLISPDKHHSSRVLHAPSVDQVGSWLVAGRQPNLLQALWALSTSSHGI